MAPKSINQGQRVLKESHIVSHSANYIVFIPALQPLLVVMIFSHFMPPHHNDMGPESLEALLIFTIDEVFFLSRECSSRVV